MIISTYVVEPSFPPDRFFAGALRKFTNGLWVDYTGNLPPNSEIQTHGVKSGTTKIVDQTMIAGNLVYSSSDGHVDKAKADAAGTAQVVGSVLLAITSGNTAAIQGHGVMTLTVAEWDAVAGTTGGLTAGTKYYLSPTTAGKWTSVKPTTIGQYVILLGTAISVDDMICVRAPEPFLIGGTDTFYRADGTFAVLRVENRTDDPVSPSVGQVWLRTDL